jgi:hypothetical protein
MRWASQFAGASLSCCMTILRLPGAGQEGLAGILASSDDAAVNEGLLSVTVRPWQVIMNVLPSPA